MPLGYAAGALGLLLAEPSTRTLLLGLPLALAGEALRVWAAGHIEKTRKLATGGPYAHTRNPLYVGSLALAAGIVVAAGSWLVGAVVAAYLLAFYPAVVREEAAFLKARFPEEYPAWEKQVPLFLPRPTPAGPRGSRFDWKRVGENREWRTVVALPGLAALLWARGLV